MRFGLICRALFFYLITLALRMEAPGFVYDDMTQITMAINNFRYQVCLRLLEMDANNPESIGFAADKINKAAKTSIGLVEECFEKIES